MSPTVADRIGGVLFGQAIGDALGFGTEFLAAVAGALLGARFGEQGIEPTWREGLLHRQELAERAERLLALCAAG